MLAKVRRMVRDGVGPLVDLFLPEVCWAGGEGVVSFGLSQGVRERIAILAGQGFCFHCGLTIGPYEKHDAKNPCGRCGERDIGVARVARVGIFAEPLIGLVHRLKFGRGGGRGAWETAGIVAPFVYQAMMRVAEQTGTPVEQIVPVPLHWSRRAKRGFNQAEELARAIARLSGWKVVQALKRIRRTQEQALLEYREHRLENLRGAFEWRRGAEKTLAGKHVWLMDDVTTTGATIHAAASALRTLPKGQKPASINAAVICVTDHKAPPAV